MLACQSSHARRSPINCSWTWSRLSGSAFCVAVVMRIKESEEAGKAFAEHDRESLPVSSCRLRHLAFNTCRPKCLDIEENPKNFGQKHRAAHATARFLAGMHVRNLFLVFECMPSL